MAAARIQPMGASIGNTIRAPGILPALHNVVEELIMNSLDSGASSIRVQIDLSRFSVEVYDSGQGIHERVLTGFLGQWHFSSKTAGDDASYGFRGEALAAINELSDLTVISKTLDGKTVERTFGNRKSTGRLLGELDPLRDMDSGTIVKAINVFGRFPVRQRVMKGTLEIARIREFVQKMAILHHKCEWCLEVFGNQHPLIQLSSDLSVASRFAKIVGQDMLTTMVPVDVCCNGLQLVGLMSPPLPECCHLRRDCQFFYLGKRWMRGRDFVTAQLNAEFRSLSEIVNGKVYSCGPQPKHAASYGSHPCFVLQLICTDPCNEYDLYTEPSKTVAVFREPKRVQEVIMKLFTVLLLHCKKLEKTVLCELTLNLDNDAGMVPDESIGVTQCEMLTYKVRDGPILEDGSTSGDTLFRSAFLPSPSIDSSVSEPIPYTLTDLATRKNSRMVNMDIAMEDSDPEQEEHSSRLASNDAIKFYSVTGKKMSVETPENNIKAEANSQASLQPCSYANVTEKTFSNTFLSSPDVDARQLIDKTNRYASEGNDTSSPIVQYNNVMSNTLSRGALAALHISKDTLRNDCTVIGQADKKYLILRIGKLLVAADQHAVDERVKLEQFASALTRDKPDSVGIPPVFLTLDAAKRVIICERKPLLNSCGFFFDHCEHETGVILTSVPFINGEALVGSDFLEFLHLLDKNIIPDSLCKPPAVSRILASHACRQSIKFGDFLALEQCQCLMRKLSVVENPFICAHGRVSMVPLMNLHTFAASSEAFSTNNNRIAFHSKLKKRSKPNYNTLFGKVELRK